MRNPYLSRLCGFVTLAHSLTAPAEQWEHGEAGLDMSLHAEFLEEEEEELQRSNGLPEGEEEELASGEGRHNVSRLDSLAESELLQPSDGEREEDSGHELPVDMMGVLEDQPFEVLDSAGGTDPSQDPSQLGKPCICVPTGQAIVATYMYTGCHSECDVSLTHACSY